MINILQSTEDKFSEYSRKMGVIPTINETHDIREGSCGYTPDGKSRNKPASSDLIKLKEKLEQVNEKLCKKGEAYRKRRMAAGEKSSAYLSGRAVKVCKGQMSGKKKKK